MSAHWELLPHFVLRTTGLPFDWIEDVAFCDSAAALDALLDAEDDLGTHRDELEAAFRAADPPPLRRYRRTCWDAVRRGRTIALDDALRAVLGGPIVALCERWNTAVTRRDGLEAAAREVFDGELLERRGALRTIAEDPRFAEALWLSSPQMHARGLRRYVDSWSARRRSETRRIEQQLVAYLQRFCAKNDTASFFGPINYGDFRAPEPGAEGLAPGADHLRHREAFLAYWAVAALAETIGTDADVRPHLRPRPAPAADVDVAARQARIAGRVTVRLGEPECAMLEHVDGRTVTEIAAATGLDLAGTVELLDDLVRRRVVVLALEVPVTALRPLTWLQDWVRALPEGCAARARWGLALEELERAQRSFAHADLDDKQRLLRELEQRLTAITGQDPRRGAGDFYADRLVIYEECLGGMTPLSLGRAFADTLREELGPVLDAYAAHAVSAHAALQRHGASVLEPLAGEDGVPFLSAAAHLAEHELPPPPTTAWQRAAVAQLAPHAAEREVELRLSELPGVDPADDDGYPLLTSPDLMLLAHDVDALRAGDFTIVMAECHDTLMVWGWALAFHPQRDAVERSAQDLFDRLPARQTVANVLPSRRVKILPFEYPGPTIEIGMASERSHGRIPAAAVTALVRDGRPQLRARGCSRPLTLANGELRSLAHSVFAPPRVVPPALEIGAHAPRIVSGRTVLQRERWRLRRADLLPGRYQGTSFELMADFRRAARHLGLPRFCYARIPTEPKPVLVDRDGYFLLELFAHLAGDGVEIELSEMLPSPGELWLTGPEGAFCAELRMGAFHVDAHA